MKNIVPVHLHIAQSGNTGRIFITAFIPLFLLSLHFLRMGNYGLFLSSLALPFFILSLGKWSLLWVILGELTALAIWMVTTFQLLDERILLGLPWVRLFLILLSVIAITAFSIQKLVKWWQTMPKLARMLPFWTSLSTGILLLVIHWKSGMSLLLAERFFPGLWPFQILMMVFYAGFIIQRLADPAQTAKTRRGIWMLFSIVFFLQFALGLSITEKFLQTGEIHLPIPALIVGGPFYRGGGFFMTILLLVTILLSGPAWCSHLCYIGALDNVFADRKKRPRPLPINIRQNLRLFVLILTVAIAVALNMGGFSVAIAGTLAIGFAGLSILAMVFISGKTGYMFHCTSVCPVGWITSVAGKINPFRIRINNQCTDCQVCTMACKYGALNREDILQRKPNISCTLCGDCIGACPHDALEYRFPGLSPNSARNLFLGIIVTLHTIFLAVARI